MRTNRVISGSTRSPDDWPQHICLCRDRLLGIGGAERVIIEQAQSLVQAGYRCSIVVFQIDERARRELPSEASLTVLGEKRRSDLLFIPKLLKLWRTLRKLRPDCVIAHQSLSEYLRIVLAGTGIPYFLLKYTSIFYMGYDRTKYSVLYRHVFDTVRGSSPAYQEGVASRLSGGLRARLVAEYYGWRDWWGTRGARRVFTLGSRSRWELEQLYGIAPIEWTPGSAHATTRPPSDLKAIAALRERFSIRNGQALVLSVNRLEYRKRVHLLVGAMRHLLDKGIDARLVIVGIGEEEAALKEQVRQLKLTDNVAFAGLVDEATLTQVYHMADVVGCMIWGSWALSVMEPLLYDKRIVISNEDANLLEGVPNVFKVSPDSQSVAAGIERALTTPAGNSSKIVKQSLEWSTQNGKLLKHIRSAYCKGNGGAEPSSGHQGLGDRVAHE